MPDIAEIFSQANWMEWTATAFLLVYVVLAIRQNPWCWPVSMVGVALFAILAYQNQIYGELPLQAYYLGISVYGWYAWRKGGKGDNPLPVSTMRGKLWVKVLVIGMVGTLAYGYLLDNLAETATLLGMPALAVHFPQTDVAWWDSFTTVFSFIAVWLQARKKLENWLFWIVIDVVYVGLFLYKELALFSGLNALYVGMAVVGYVAWRKASSDHLSQERSELSDKYE